MRKEWEGDSSSAQDKLVSNEFINEWMAALIASNRNRSHFTEELICGRMLLWLSFSLTWLDLLCFTLFCFFIIHPRQYLKAATSWLEKFTVFSLQLSAIIVKQLERSFDSFWLINHTHEWLGRAASRAESESKSSRTESNSTATRWKRYWNGKFYRISFFIIVVVVALRLPPCLIWKSRERWTAASTSETRFSISFQCIGDTHRALSCRVCVVCSRHRAHKQWRY